MTEAGVPFLNNGDLLWGVALVLIIGGSALAVAALNGTRPSAEPEPMQVFDPSEEDDE